MRGKRAASLGDGDVSGITPACAGKTPLPLRAPSRQRDHPRVCGENRTDAWSVYLYMGSPPRVRGKHQILPDRSGWRGITPACAGKTEFCRFGDADGRDHPRVCGENPSLALAVSELLGSPPRVRGKPSARGLSRTRPGITPACAGKTARSAWRFMAVRDHPRVCGENSFLVFSCTRLVGSPPRVRGKLAKKCEVTVDTGITPACAGKTPKCHARSL